MVGFFCVTLFHIFLSALIRRRYFDHCGAVLYIASPLNIRDIDSEALLKCGFDEAIPVEDDNASLGREHVFDYLMFYTLYPRCHHYLKALRRKKMVLVYEGITNYQLNQWSGGDSSKRIDLNRDIDEFWLPKTALLIDEEYLPRCREFSIGIDELSANELSVICAGLNAVFRYEYQAIDTDILFMDRYLAKYGNFVLNNTVERILTQVIYYGTGGAATIKKHPYDEDYKRKYQGLEGVRVIEDNVPWELIYLNNKLYNDKFRIGAYLMYNSFAPANIALLFGDHSFQCICVEPILDKYADIESTYLNSGVTNVILDKFAQECGVEVKFVKTIEDLKKEPAGVRYSTDDVLWEKAEEELKNQGIEELLEIRAFRLQIDCALLSLKKTAGSYYFNADNFSAEISRTILRIALPHFTEAAEQKDGDIIVDCDGTLVDYSKDSFDVRRFFVVEGCFRLAGPEVKVEMYLKNVENIYIWGAARSNIETFNILKKCNLTHKIRCVFDSYATGTNHGLPILPFSPKIIENNSFIFVCAAVAYPEIAGILAGCGFQEGVDFTIGVGIKDV